MSKKTEKAKEPTEEQSANETLNSEQLATLLEDEMAFQVQTQDEETRLQCLKIAADVSRSNISEVLKSADRMFEFIKGY